MLRKYAAREHRNTGDLLPSATKPCPAAGSAGTCYGASSHAQVSHLLWIPSSRTRRRIARKTAYLSVRARERPHWLELGVRCDVTLHDLDRFLRGIWLECCGHVSHFKVGDHVYSTLVPMPGVHWRFEPMDEVEARWRHMMRTINAAVPPLSRFEYEHDYGDPTELTLEHRAVFGDLAQAISPVAAVARWKNRYPGQEQPPAGLPDLWGARLLEGRPGVR